MLTMTAYLSKLFSSMFKSFELWHLYKSLLPSAKGLSFTFMKESVVFLLIPTYSLVGKHHVMGKDLSIYGHIMMLEKVTELSLINLTHLLAFTLHKFFLLSFTYSRTSKN